MYSYDKGERVKVEEGLRSNSQMVERERVCVGAL